MLKSLFHHLKIVLFGTKEYEKEWQDRHEFAPDSGDWGEKYIDWVKGYWNSVDHPHREYLVQAIVDLNPSSLLEVGCNCGPNLRMLAERLPRSRLIGIDINRESIEKGNGWMNAEGITNVHLEVGNADDLSRYPDRSFDIVFTDAVLIYIGPDKIEDVLQGFVRVARKNIVLCELDISPSPVSETWDQKGKFIFRRGLWAHNFVSLFRCLVPNMPIKITRIPIDLWDDEIWRKYGALIEMTSEEMNLNSRM
jgi:ubiquinone/menaquinone biosynthesis C-methylase UbiE